MIAFEVLAPLSQFRSKLGPVEIQEGVFLRPLTPDEQRRIVRGSATALGVFGMGISTPKFALSLRTEVDFESLSDYERAVALRETGNESFQAIQTGLRLLQDSDVYCGLRVVNFDQVPDSFSNLERPLPTPLFPKTGMHRDYRFGEGDIEPLKLVVEWLRGDRASNIKLAINRFNSCFERRSSEDQLIDAWIGLEALFGESAELKYRMSSRISRYIGTSPDEREWIFNLARNTYDARSAIVHGNRPKLHVRQARDAVVRMLSRSLIRSLEGGHPPPLDRLDIQTVRGEGNDESFAGDIGPSLYS